MACRITSIKLRKTAFTLVEMLVAMGIGSIALASIASFSLYAGRSVISLANYAELESRSRLALDRMTQEIRQTRGLTDFTTSSLSFKDSDGAALSYVYDPAAKTLARLKDGQRNVLLEECESLTFGVFQRNPIGGSYEVYPTALPSTAKLIQVTWSCSRSILGAKVNSETVQLSRIVIRNHD